MKFKRLSLVAVLAIAVMALGTGSAVAWWGSHSSDHFDKRSSIRAGVSHGKPKNVIFLLGDGMGVSEITAARYYQGVNNPLNIDRLKLTGFDTTWSVKPGAGPNYLPDYDSESASTGTQWATGKKTIDGRLSQGPSSAANVPGTNYKNIGEVMRDLGKKTGNVSTAEITDATPGAIESHISQRGCQGPANMAACPLETKGAGGLGSVAEQSVDSKFDVILGGGRARYTQTIGSGPDAGKTVVQSAQAKGYQYVTDAAGLSAITNKNKPVLGLFNDGNMSLEWSGPAASLGKGNTPAACTEGIRPANEPALEAMTKKALTLLDGTRNGFFLQVEGASIDKQDHATNACGQIGETVAFDRAIGVAVDYQRTHPDTLIVVTADHSHTSQIVEEDASGSGIPAGYNTNLLSKDGQTLSLTYGTAGFGGAGNAPVATPPSQQHTGAVVPVWGSGPGAIDVLGTNDHTDLFNVFQGKG
jgi:alkaline phosphatase/streptomycin-6-phosphatase